jgi:hypothetical protein
MRNRISSLYSGAADLASSRAGTARTLSSTAIQEAAAGRVARDDLRQEDLRQGELDRSGQRVAAYQQAYAGAPQPAATVLAAATPTAQALAGPPVSDATPPAPTPKTTGVPPSPAPSGAVESSFMGAVSTQVKNPFALAAIAATGKHESAFDPRNVNREWADGKNKAGGIMSWNGPRLEAMKAFTGGDVSPEAQAAFFLQEDPALIKRLEATTSVEEAVSIMNDAWRFKGYNQQGGEAARRLETAKAIHAGGAATPVVSVQQGAITTTPLAAPVPQAVTPGPGQRGVVGASEAVPAGPATPAEQAITSTPRGPTTQNDTSSIIAQAAGNTQVSPNQATPSVAPASPATAQDAYVASLLAAGNLTGDQIVSRLKGLRAAGEEGRVDRAAVRGRAVAEIIAQSTQDAANNPDTYNTETAMKTLRNSKEFKDMTAIEQLQAIEQATASLNGVLGTQLSPSTVADPSVAAASQTEVEAMDQTLAAMPQSDLFALSKRFGDTGDVSQALIDELSLGADGETPAGSWLVYDLDKNTLDKHIEEIAKAAGPQVTKERAAAAMVKVFDRDPLGYNTLANRFDFDDAVEYINTHLNDDAVKAYKGVVAKHDRRKNDIVGTTLKLNRLKTKYEKLEPGAQKDQAAREIETLRNILRSGSTLQGANRTLADYIGPEVASRLRNLGPGSDRHKTAVTLIRNQIQADTSLSEDEKRAMISQL